jgi:thioredoxin-related protein
MFAWHMHAAVAHAQPKDGRAVEIPSWFSETFLDVREDVRDAAAQGKRLLVYFGQDGCPYCAELMRVNFSQARIVEKTRRGFVAVALNIWGDREVTWTDGRVRSEKEFARFLKVQFTPTILMLDEAGKVVARLNGYQPPQRFEAAIDFVAGRRERSGSFEAHMRAAVAEPASERLHDEPFFMKQPLALARKPGSRPLAVLFETPSCAGCDELHRDAFRRPAMLELLGRFDVSRLELGASSPMVTPDGRKSTVRDWVTALRIAYTPTLALFDERGREVLRIEAYVRPFHLAAALDYVASGAYRTEPAFQRFVQGRAEAMRGRGEAVKLWE